MLVKNIGHFLDICHKLFLNNARFAADVVGFMIHTLGLHIFPKSFGFFLGCSRQDLLEIFCGRSLPRKATEIPSNMFLQNCLWIFPIKTIVGYSLKNYEVTSGVCPEVLFLRKSVCQICIGKPVGWYLPRKKISRRYPAQRLFFGGGYPPRHCIYCEDTL